MTRKHKAKPGATVGSYISSQPAPQREILERLRALVREEAPQASEAIKWGCPWYGHHGHLCALMRHKEYVRLQFVRGVDLADPKGLLEGTGKGMRHLKVHSLEALPEAAVRAWVREAVNLNTSPRG